MNDTITKLNTSTGLDIHNNISNMIFSCDQTIYYFVVSKLALSFEMIENESIRENPNLQNKILFYLFHGQKIIDKHKT